MTLTAIIRAARRLTGRHVPAAPDNQQSHDVLALITCRYILREPLRDPHDARLANDYLRRKEGDQP